MAKGTGIDLLVYHDLTDTTERGARLELGANAAEEFGDIFEGMYIVAIGDPVHDSKDVTVVLAHGSRPMPEMQALLDSRSNASHGE